jgi:hypothetical protein
VPGRWGFDSRQRHVLMFPLCVDDVVIPIWGFLLCLEVLRLSGPMTRKQGRRAGGHSENQVGQRSPTRVSTTQPCKHLSPSYTIHLIRLLAELSKKPRASRIQVLIMEFQRAIVVTRFAVLDFHWALSDARRQSDKVDNVQCTIPTRPIASINFLDTTY